MSDELKVPLPRESNGNLELDKRTNWKVDFPEARSNE